MTCQQNDRYTGSVTEPTESTSFEATGFDDAETRAWNGYLRMGERLATALHRNLVRDSRISLPDYQVLSVVARAPDQKLRAFEIGTDLQWEKSRLSHHLKRMETRGLVERVVCESDGRGLWVSLTAEGKRAFGAATPGHVEDVRRMLLNVLTPEQVAELAVISEKVLAGEVGEVDLCQS